MALIKSEEEIAKIRSAGRILARVLDELKGLIQPGIALKDLDDVARGFIRKLGGEPAFLGYKPTGALKPFPAALCTSLNDVVVHGVPTSRRLKTGDVLKLDLGVKFEGYYADAAATVAVPETDPRTAALIAATESALNRAVALVRPGKALGDIGYAIQEEARKRGFKIVKGLTGHGVGTDLHEEPSVLNEGRPGKGMKLKTGMVIAIEPMVSAGSPFVKKLSDDSYATVDGSLSAHFEHTVAITDKGAEVLTMLE